MCLPNSVVFIPRRPSSAPLVQVGGYSAMDLLSSCNLLNYFGKQEKVDDIENYPILISKGTTKVCFLPLFGTGTARMFSVSCDNACFPGCHVWAWQHPR